MNEMNGFTLSGDYHQDRIKRLAARYQFLESGFNAGAEITDQALSDFEHVVKQLIALKQKHPELFTNTKQLTN